jgi:hypothetical protein
VQELIDEGLPVLQPYLSSSVKVRESHERAKPLIYLMPKHKLTLQYVAVHTGLEERRQVEARKRASSVIEIGQRIRNSVLHDGLGSATQAG